MEILKDALCNELRQALKDLDTLQQSEQGQRVTRLVSKISRLCDQLDALERSGV